MPAPPVETMTYVEQWQWFLALRRNTLFQVRTIAEHGTQTRYNEHLCRCQPCKAAHNVYTKPYKAAFAERERKKKAASAVTR